MNRAVCCCAPLLALVGACFGDTTPTGRVGGTEYNMNLSVPSPVRLPAASVTVKSRTVLGVPTVDTITLVASLLKPLTGKARYQLYLVNALDSSARPIVATVSTTRTDSGFAGAAVVTTPVMTSLGVQRFFNGAPFNTTTTLRITSLGGADTIGVTSGFVVVTIQSDTSGPAYAPATPKPLWFRFRDQKGTTTPTDDAIIAAGSASFGFFNVPGASRIFAAQGYGRSAFWDRAANGKLTLAALAIGLTQPPPGYYYQPAAVDARTGTILAFGTLVDATTGASLREADSTTVTGVVAQLPNARFTVADDSLGKPFTAFTAIQLLLEPKAGDPSVPSATNALQGTVPSLLTTRRAIAGTITATVTRNTAGVPGVTVVVYGRGNSTVIASKLTDTTGTAVITNIPSGSVDVRIFPPTGLTAPAPIQRGVTVPPGGSVAVAFALP
ncbi:MAG: carboxypeptidase-like regulatory domain-containing protein [Gemmatimonadaceae bacterium]